MNQKNDHDLLIGIQSTVGELKKEITNHLAHHAKAVNRLWFIVGGVFMLLGQAGIAMLIRSLPR